MKGRTKPRIFISSTVYDFQDLRSALEFHLEGLGYEVLLSDRNDFGQPLDDNSYRACLRVIDSADYFILLVGTRVGGLYSRPDKVSITRMEYRHAYERLLQGRTRLAAFVRRDVWTARADRKALRRLLLEDYRERAELDDATAAKLSECLGLSDDGVRQMVGLSEKEVKSLVHHRSDIVNDAEAIFGFLDEVARLEEMKKAAAGEGPLPVGNWIYQFSTFQEVVDALRVEFDFRESLSKVALRLNLTRELVANLTIFFRRDTFGQPRPAFDRGVPFMRTVPEEGGTTLRPEEYNFLMDSYFGFAQRDHILSTRSLDYALNSGEFLEYNPGRNRYESGLLNNALHSLREEIVTLRRLMRDFERMEEPLKTEFYRRHIIRGVYLDTLWEIYFAQRKIFELSAAVVKALDGDLKALARLTKSLKPRTAAGITAADVERYLHIR